jgi:hypothetical protein
MQVKLVYPSKAPQYRGFHVQLMASFAITASTTDNGGGKLGGGNCTEIDDDDEDVLNELEEIGFIRFSSSSIWFLLSIIISSCFRFFSSIAFLLASSKISSSSVKSILLIVQI